MKIFKKKTLLERARAVPFQEQRKEYAKNEDCLEEYLEAILAWSSGEIKSKQLAIAVSDDFDIARTSLYSFMFSVVLQGIRERKIVIKKQKDIKALELHKTQ